MPRQVGGEVHPPDGEGLPLLCPGLPQKVLPLGPKHGGDGCVRVQVQVEAAEPGRVAHTNGQDRQDTDGDDESFHSLRPLFHLLGGILGGMAVLAQVLDVLVHPRSSGQHIAFHPADRL